MTQPRITPLPPPFAPEIQAQFDTLMRGAPPLRLFRTVARNPRVLSRMMAGGLLDRGSLSLRLRELMILRTTALCGAEYEWGVHVAVYGDKAGWTPQELAATAQPAGAGADCWTDEERLLLRMADALHASSDLDDALYAELGARFSDAQLIELLMLGGLYHAVSYLVNGLRVAHEDFAPRFPRD